VVVYCFLICKSILGRDTFVLDKNQVIIFLFLHRKIPKNKPMKKPIIKLFDKLILLLLGMSGIFYSCMKYGMPVDEFEIYGTVTDKEKNPIENIRVTNLDIKPLYTSADGKFRLKSEELEYHSTLLKFEDIDGEANGGEFMTQEVEVKFTGADLVKKGKRNKTDKYAKKITVELERDGFIPLYGAPTATFKP
jgi:putative lipoprotein (rSAM/lipoprotein system)